VAQPRFSDAKDRSIVTIGVTAALLSLPLATPIVAAAAGSPFQPLLEKNQPLSKSLSVRRPVARPVAVVDKATGQLVDPETGTVIDRTKAILDPATGKLIDPLTGAVIPSDALARPPVARPAAQPQARRAAKSTKSQAASPKQPVSPADASSTGSLAVPEPAPADGNDLLAPADKMVVGVVEEVLTTSSDGNLQSLTPLLGDSDSSHDASLSDDATDGSSSTDSVPASSGASTRDVSVSSHDSRTVGLASGSDAVEVQPDAFEPTSVGGTSGVPHLLGAPVLSGLHSSRSTFLQQDLEVPQISMPADFDHASSMTADDLTTSERQFVAGKVTATPLPKVFDEAPTWLVSTASGLLVVVGGAGVAYGTRRLRRRTV
jgi:hypothetical protein